MKILYISNYAAWDRVYSGELPSHHLFGVHEMVAHYEHHHSTNGCSDLRGILSGGGMLTSI